MENIINARLDVNFNREEQTLEFVTSKQEILRILLASKNDNSSVAVRSDVLGEGTHVTAVQEIILEDGEINVIFKPYDITGFMLSQNRLTIAEIDAVCALASTFENPVLKSIEKDKSWFF